MNIIMCNKEYSLKTRLEVEKQVNVNVHPDSLVEHSEHPGQLSERDTVSRP